MQRFSFFILLQHYLASRNKSITTEAEYKKAIETLKKLYTKKNKSFLITSGISFLLLMLFFCIANNFFILPSYISSKRFTFDWQTLLIRLAVSLLISLIIGLIRYSILNRKINIRESQIQAYDIIHLQEAVDNDLFENSIKMSYKYLDQYYDQTREQAKRGFSITVAISIVGAILIFIGVGAMFLGKTDPSYITCAAGAITEFISAIFFYLYNKTISSMSQYHNKLVLSQNISIALRVADSLPEDKKAEAKSTIVNELLKDINTYLVEEEPAKK